MACFLLNHTECVLFKKISQLLSDDIWSNTKFFWRREDRIEQETSWRYSLWSDFAATISRDFFFFLIHCNLKSFAQPASNSQIEKQTSKPYKVRIFQDSFGFWIIQRNKYQFAATFSRDIFLLLPNVIHTL